MVQRLADSVERIGMQTKSFKDLIVWQKSFQLVAEIYRITKNFPKEEIFGFSQQMRRCAVSIPSNVAEGYGRQYNKEYRQFLSMAYGSVCELETQYLLSLSLNFTEKDEKVEGLLKEVGSMLYRMINPVR